MLHTLAKRIAAYCFHGSGRPEADLEIAVFGIETQLADLVQVAILVAAAILMRRPVSLLCCAVCFMSVKTNVGDVHAETHLACISIFTTLAVCAVLVAAAVPAGIVPAMVHALSAATLLIVWWKGPIPHPNNPKSAAATQHSRKTNLLTAGIQFCVLPLLSLLGSHWSLAAALGGIAAAVSLVIPNRRKGGREDEGRE